jgi:hypothetical protein
VNQRKPRIWPQSHSVRRLWGDVLMARAAHAGVIEVVALGLWYASYSGARLLADGNLPRAQQRTRVLESVERHLRIDVEHTLNRNLAHHDVISWLASYWYEGAHYVVTAGVLVWLFRYHRDVYARARTTLVLVTMVALGFYLLMPTAPPRLMGEGFQDILALTADHGWWLPGATASPGSAGVKNELAAFPSMHAGWAAWTAFAARDAHLPTVACRIADGYALLSVLVILATANHWLLDAAVGILLMAGGYLLVRACTKRYGQPAA